MKTRLLTIALLLTAWSMAPIRYTLQPDSRLWVAGTSSLHDWECEAEKFTGVLDLTETDGLKTAEVTVRVGDLECKNGTMNKKLRAALQNDTNPTIRFELTKPIEAPTTKDGVLTATGRLTIAGTTKVVKLQVQAERLADDRVRYHGVVPISMRDFGVDPPSAMLGALKTGNDVTVHFDVFAGR